MKIFEKSRDNILFEDDSLSIKKTIVKALEAFVNLSYADLSHTSFEWMDLSYRDFENTYFGYSQFERACLKGCCLRHADLRYASFIGANLKGADLEWAYLSNANFKGAILVDTKLGGELDTVNFSQVDLSGAVLWGEQLSKTPLIISSGLPYKIWITDTRIKIGRTFYNTPDFMNLKSSPDEKMNNFLKEWKKDVLSLVKHHQRREV